MSRSTICLTLIFVSIALFVCGTVAQFMVSSIAMAAVALCVTLSGWIPYGIACRLRKKAE